MQNCGTLQIKCNKNIDFSLYDFGISQVNNTVPYLWGGINTLLPNGEKVQIFSGLDNGSYTWFVRKKSSGQIIKQGVEEVICVSGSSNVKTFFFSNVFQNEENNYIFDLTTKKITLKVLHGLFGKDFEILNSSFNGVVVKSSTGNIQPNLSNFDEIIYFQNSFDLSSMYFSNENLFSVTVNFN